MILSRRAFLATVAKAREFTSERFRAMMAAVAANL
jgi:hypothetical protein